MLTPQTENLLCYWSLNIWHYLLQQVRPDDYHPHHEDWGATENKVDSSDILTRKHPKKSTIRKRTKLSVVTFSTTAMKMLLFLLPSTETILRRKLQRMLNRQSRPILSTFISPDRFVMLQLARVFGLQCLAIMALRGHSNLNSSKDTLGLY